MEDKIKNILLKQQGNSKTKAKQTYNKGLYELLPSFKLEASEVYNILGITYDYEERIVLDTFTSILEGESFRGGCIIS